MKRRGIVPQLAGFLLLAGWFACQPSQLDRKEAFMVSVDELHQTISTYCSDLDARNEEVAESIDFSYLFLIREAYPRYYHLLSKEEIKRVQRLRLTYLSCRFWSDTRRTVEQWMRAWEDQYLHTK
jgi:hypothetical protein